MFFGGSTQSNLWNSQKHGEYATASGKYYDGNRKISMTNIIFIVRSRSLLSIDPKLDFHVRACDWFKQVFLSDELGDFEVNLSTQVPFRMQIATNIITAVNISRNEDHSILHSSS